MAKYKSTTLRFPLEAILRDRRTKAAVPAVVAPMVETDVDLWSSWDYAKDADDRSWEWDSFFAHSAGPDSETECYSVVSREKLQGLVSLLLSGKSAPDGKALVVEYLASSPANRSADSGLKDVGFVLIALAVHRSRELGWEGRLWLESLPDAEIFYERCGFTRLPGLSAEGYAMFYLNGVAATAIWDKVRKADILRLPE